jgi:hypothetical protein
LVLPFLSLPRSRVPVAVPRFAGREEPLFGQGSLLVGGLYL